MKLLVAEPESPALRRRLHDWPRRASATLLRTDATRALRRSGHDDVVGKARRLFGGLRLDEPLLDRAGDLAPPDLRPLDAIHLAAALSIGPDLGVFFAYDQRLSEAAAWQGLDVEAPS